MQGILLLEKGRQTSRDGKGTWRGRYDDVGTWPMGSGGRAQKRSLRLWTATAGGSWKPTAKTSNAGEVVRLWTRGLRLLEGGRGRGGPETAIGDTRQ
jgi:hypothetical protein